MENMSSWTWDVNATQAPSPDNELAYTQPVDIPYKGRSTGFPGVATYITPVGAPVDPTRPSPRTRRAIRHRLAAGAYIPSDALTPFPTGMCGDWDDSQFPPSLVARELAQDETDLAPLTDCSPVSSSAYLSEDQISLEECGDTGTNVQPYNAQPSVLGSAYSDYEDREPRSAAQRPEPNPLPRHVTYEGSNISNDSAAQLAHSAWRPSDTSSESRLVSGKWNSFLPQASKKNLKLTDHELQMSSSLESAGEGSNAETSMVARRVRRRDPAYQPVPAPNVFSDWDPCAGGGAPSSDRGFVLPNYWKTRESTYDGDAESSGDSLHW